MNRETKLALRCLAEGQPPPARHADRLLGGFGQLLEHWQEDLRSYVMDGGSLLRIVSAQAGGGKTHLGRALQAMAARDGFLVCQIDAQANLTDDDLHLYRAVCQGLRLPDAFLSEDNLRGGLMSMLLHAAAQPEHRSIREAIGRARVPVPALQQGLLLLFDAIRQGRYTGGGGSEEDPFREVGAFLSGERPRPLAAARRAAAPLRHVQRIPGKRDARLWLESLLLLCRPLGFSGVVLVLDEHDEVRSGQLDTHIVQLRRTLDRLAEGRLPGVFALYLVLDTFRERIRARHEAVHQRVTPLADPPPARGLLTDLGALRDHDRGESFLHEVGTRIYEFAAPGARSLPGELVSFCERQADRYITLGHVDTRSFVKVFARKVLDAA